MKKLLASAIAATAVAIVGCASASTDNHITDITSKHRGEMGFPEFAQPSINGAPKLSDPMLIMGSTKPVQSGKHGLAAPALWDWNGDGKRDLLVGEFETCAKGGGKFPGGELYGSSVRVYLNVSADNNPRFTDDYFYAKDTEGTVMEVEQWCCIGFTPQFVDLNNDGHLDMITGQYHPGDVTWFRGSDKGFLPGVKLDQEGDPSVNGQGMPDSDIRSFGYWNYSSASFGDFTNDGLQDLIVGGSALRISKNMGTKEQPKFGRRELLLDINGEPLMMKHMSQERVEELESYGVEKPPSGSGKIQQVVTDWDNDGVLDILATDYYLDVGSRAVSFFRGVKTRGEHRFEQGIDLLKTADGSKALPGTGNRLYVDDWNKDGINDLIIGASIVTVRDKFHDRYSWEWESITGIQSAGKDAGHPPAPVESWENYFARKDIYWREKRKRPMTEEQIRKRYQSSLDWRNSTLTEQADPNSPEEKIYRHQGRIYVLLGK